MKTPAPLGGEATERLRATVLEALPDFDHSRAPEQIEVSTEIAVGQGAEPPEFGEGEAFRMHDERGHDAEPGLLVQRPIEAVVRVAARPLVTFGSPLPGRHKPPRDGTIPRL